MLLSNFVRHGRSTTYRPGLRSTLLEFLISANKLRHIGSSTRQQLTHRTEAEPRDQHKLSWNLENRWFFREQAHFLFSANLLFCLLVITELKFIRLHTCKTHRSCESSFVLFQSNRAIFNWLSKVHDLCFLWLCITTLCDFLKRGSLSPSTKQK